MDKRIEGMIEGRIEERIEGRIEGLKRNRRKDRRKIIVIGILMKNDNSNRNTNEE